MTLSFPFHDIEVEDHPEEPGARLVKILSQDGQRFTYLLRTTLDAAASEFVRRMIEGGMNVDLLIVRTEAGILEARESPVPLPRHG
jgi:hypothetical protein